MLHTKDNTKLLVHLYHLNNSSRNYQKILTVLEIKLGPQKLSDLPKFRKL